LPILAMSTCAERAKLIDIEQAAENVLEGDPWAFMDRSPDSSKKHRRGGRVHAAGNDTTHFCVIDRWGNSVGELQSIQTMFGSRVIAGSTGILLNNRMTYWHLDPNHIDFLNPGQRSRSRMAVIWNLYAALPGVTLRFRPICR